MRVDDFLNLWNEVGNDAEYSLLVTGHSMRPFLVHDISVVYIRKWAKSDLKNGSIVLYLRKNGALMLHRVIKQYPNGRMLVNGDAQYWSEEIGGEQVIAQVMRFCRTKRVISADNLLYRLLIRIWLALRPVRPWMFWVGSKLKEGKRRLCGKK